MDHFPSPDDTISACVPRAALDVFDAIVSQDFDTPIVRCGTGLRFLLASDLVAQGNDRHPLVVTALGRELARERGMAGLVAGRPQGVGGVIEW